MLRRNDKSTGWGGVNGVNQKNASNGIYGTKRRVFCCKKKAKHALSVVIQES